MCGFPVGRQSAAFDPAPAAVAEVAAVPDSAAVGRTAGPPAALDCIDKVLGSYHIVVRLQYKNYIKKFANHF